MTFPTAQTADIGRAAHFIAQQNHDERPVASGWRDIVIGAIDGFGCSEHDLETLLDRVERTR